MSLLDFNRDGKVSNFEKAVGMAMLASELVTIVCVVGLVLTEVDTSGMSYEEAVRAIDLKYLPVFVSGISLLVSMLTLFVLVLLAPKYEIEEAGNQG